MSDVNASTPGQTVAGKIAITEYLAIDLASERWHCRVCDQDLGNARGPYKEALLVYDRDPREIHRPKIDAARYEFTYSPDPAWCRIIEYYCPQCGTQIETEYLPPGHPLTVDDLILDIDSLKARHLLSGDSLSGDSLSGDGLSGDGAKGAQS